MDGRLPWFFGATAAVVAYATYACYSKPRATRKLIMLAQPKAPAEARSTIAKAHAECKTMILGAMANAASETTLAGPFTHCALISYDSAAMLASSPKLSFYKDAFAVHVATIGGGALELEYEPTVQLAASPNSLPVAPLRHVFFVRFKPGCPVRDMITGYSGLTETIKEMRCFEYSKLNEATSEGYQYVFMTTFNDSHGRDAYLAHPVHDAFAAKILPWADKIIIFDFIDGQW